MQSDLFRLRHRIYKQFPDSSDLDAFLIDFFPHVYAKASRGMTCVALVTLLFLSESNNVDGITEALDGIAAKPPVTSPRRKLRKQLEQQCPTSDDLDALLIDHFTDISRILSPGMSTTAKINILIFLVDTELIHSALLAQSGTSTAVSANTNDERAMPTLVVDAPSSAVTSTPRHTSTTRPIPVVQDGAAPTQPLSLTGSTGIGSENKIVHVTLLDKHDTKFDLFRWEQPYPERFTKLRIDPDARHEHLLSFARNESSLTIEALPTLLIDADSHLKQTQITVYRDENHNMAPIHRVYWYCPAGKHGGVRYLLRIVGEPESLVAPDSPYSWRWTIELIDKEELPHLYLRFIWSQ